MGPMASCVMSMSLTVGEALARRILGRSATFQHP